MCKGWMSYWLLSSTCSKMIQMRKMQWVYMKNSSNLLVFHYMICHWNTLSNPSFSVIVRVCDPRSALDGAVVHSLDCMCFLKTNWLKFIFFFLFCKFHLKKCLSTKAKYFFLSYSYLIRCTVWIRKGQQWQIKIQVWPVNKHC